MLWFKKESLNAPNDFKEDESFLKLCNKIEKIGIRQEISQFDLLAEDISEYKNIIFRLVEKQEIELAIQIGKSYLKVQKYKISNEIFSYLKNEVSLSHTMYIRILSNLSFTQIHLNKYKEAIENLTQIFNTLGDKKFYAWNSSALAYAYFKLGKQNLYKQ